MTDESYTAKTQSDWAQKGLGWLPDYPDLRDYQLDKEEVQKGGRLTIEETTSNLEGLAESVIHALKLLQNKFSENPESNQNPFKAIVEELQSKVFGNISFLNVKLRKILRPTPKRFESLFPSLSPLLDYQDDLWRRSLHELKIYLYLYFLEIQKLGCYEKLDATIQEFKPGDNESQKLHQEIQNLKFDRYAMEWLKGEAFDDITIVLVQTFQRENGLNPPSGVIGPYTYNLLLKALCQDASSATNILLSLDSIPPVQLISISSLVPSDVILILFEKLIDIFARNSSKANKKVTVEDIFKEDFSKVGFHPEKETKYGSYAEDIDESPFQLAQEFLSKSFSSPSTKEEEIRQWLSRTRRFWFTLISNQRKKDFHSVNARRKLLLERSYNVFSNEFKVIEPLICVILKLVMPLAFAKYRSWSEAIADGLNQFEKLTDELDPSNLTNETTNTDFMRFLAAEALQKTRQELEEGRILVTDEIINLKGDQEHLKHSVDQGDNSLQIQLELNNVNDRLQNKEEILGATLYFYFLLEKFVEYHCDKLEKYHLDLLSKRDIDFSQSSQANQGNFFDKREFLEIDKPERFYQSDFSPNGEEGKDNSKSEQATFELFPSESLQVPVLTTLPRLLGLNYLDSRTSGYFFLPGIVDLSFWCTPIEDQGALRSCTAMAGVALMEYFVNRSLGKYTDLSPLFLYKVAQKQLNLTGDVGASLRETMKAMALHGVPPESVWAYDPTKVNEEPPPFCYSYAQNYQALKYFRLDYAGISLEALLFQIKAVLSAGFPCMFGFTIYTSVYEDASAKEGWIPFPDAQRDKVRGGHAVVAVGYDDYQVIPRADRTGYTLGAFLVRNCWGKEWGKGGYGWLPYDYVRRGLTYDWWSLLKAEWFESDLLGAGANNLEGPKWLGSILDGARFFGGPGQGG